METKKKNQMRFKQMKKLGIISAGVHSKNNIHPKSNTEHSDR